METFKEFQDKLGIKNEEHANVPAIVLFLMCLIVAFCYFM